MLPTRLNLLSPNKRGHLQRMVYGQFIKNSLESLLIVLCLAGIVLLSTEWVLQGHFNDLISTLSANNTHKADQNLKIKDVNRTILELDALQAEYTHWSPLIIELGNTVPAGVRLSGMTLNAQEETQTLTGIATTREALLALQDNLEALPYISDVDVPLSQLIAKVDIRFSITAKLDCGQTDVCHEKKK